VSDQADGADSVSSQGRARARRAPRARRSRGRAINTASGRARQDAVLRLPCCNAFVETREDAFVVPLVEVQGDLTAEVMLRMLFEREAILIQRRSASGAVASGGMVAQAAGAFAKAISQATQGSARVPAGEQLYRLVLPGGAVARDLVPAVGGGFRGLVRASDSTKLIGQARLIPAVAGGGAAIAAGPLIATVGLAVAGEMLAQHQMNKKLDAIRVAVLGVSQYLDAHDRAVLTTARQETRKVAGYLLDQAQLPAIASAGYAFGELASLTNRRIEQLDEWLNVASDFAHLDKVDGQRLLTALVGKSDDQVLEFERGVAQTYEAVALRAQVVVLENVAAEFSNPNRSLVHVEQVLRSELAELASRQSQLGALLDDLSAMPATDYVVSKRSEKRKITMRTSFGRLARALHTAPDSLPMVTHDDRMVLDLAPTGSGLAVVPPPS